MPQMDGILGLGPRQDNFDNKLSLAQNPTSISLIHFLRAEGLIKEAIASFSLTAENSRSYVQFGERNMSQVVEDKLSSFELVSNDYWAVDVEHFLYDYDMPKFKGSEDIAGAVIDTGTSLLGIPPEHYQYIVAIWKQQFGDKLSCDQVVCFGAPKHEKDCSYYTSKMQAIQIMFDGETVFEIKPEGFTFIQDNYCIFGLMEFSRVKKKKPGLQREKQEKVEKQGAYLLGGVFLRNFYTVFNWEKRRIEFGVNRDATGKASISSAEEAFQQRGKPNVALENIKLKNQTESEQDKSSGTSNQDRLQEIMQKQKEVKKLEK